MYFISGNSDNSVYKYKNFEVSFFRTNHSIPDSFGIAIKTRLGYVVNMILPDRAVGGADIKISTACGFLLGVTRGAAGLTLGLVFSVICSLITRKRKDEKLPLIPYLAAGFIPAYFI